MYKVRVQQDAFQRQRAVSNMLRWKPCGGSIIALYYLKWCAGSIYVYLYMRTTFYTLQQYSCLVIAPYGTMLLWSCCCCCCWRVVPCWHPPVLIKRINHRSMTRRRYMYMANVFLTPLRAHYHMVPGTTADI